MRNKSETAVKEINADVNTALLNVISPSSVKHEMNNVSLSDNYGCVKTILKMPFETDYGWLSRLSNLEGCSTVINYRPTSSAALVETYNKKINQLKAEIIDEKEESRRQAKERQIEDMKKSIRKINEEHEEVGYVSILMHPHGVTQDLLERRSKNVDSAVGKFGGKTRILTHRQLQGLTMVSPWGIPEENQDVIKIGERNMPISTLIGGFFNAASGLHDEGGYYLGKIDDKYICIINPWLRGGDRTNGNWLITGLPGVGKSATVKTIILKEYAFGTKIIIIDPEQEYKDICKNHGGDIVDCGGGKNGIINPLEVRKPPNLDADDEFYKDEGKGMNDLALHLQTVKVFFKLYKSDLSDVEIECLEAALIEVYRQFGITWETDIEEVDEKGQRIWTSEKFPIMKNLHDEIVKRASGCEGVSDTERKIYENLAIKLRSIATGADSFLFNGYTNIKTNSQFIVLDNSKLIDGDKNVQRAQYYNMLTWTWQQASVDRTEKVIIGTDETYLMIDPEVPQSMVYLRNMSKRLRKYMGALMVITHSVNDLLDPAVKRFGQAIIDNACYKFLMGTEGKNLEETKKLFRLTDKEETILAAQKRGQGLLFAGSVRMKLQIDIDKKLLAMMGSAGGR